MPVAVKPYRCNNPACTDHPAGRPGYDFWAEPGQAVCPKCKKTQADPRFGFLIVELRIIHFEPPSDVRGIGLGHLACDPGQAVGKGAQVSGHPEAVTCPRCQQSEAFQKATAQSYGEVASAEDFPVAYDAQRKTWIKTGDQAGCC